MSGHAFFLFLVDNLPAHLLRKPMAGLALHGDICFVVGVMVNLLIRGHTVQAADPVVFSFIGNPHFHLSGDFCMGMFRFQGTDRLLPGCIIT